jgi:hypothetical protein
MHGTRQSQISKSKGRSRITNGMAKGSAVMPRSVDGRSMYQRRFRDVFALLLADAGGDDRASEAIKSMVRRASTLTVELERYECLFADADDGATPEQLDCYQRMTNTLRRLLLSIGTDRKPRDVTPQLADYINGHSTRISETMPRHRERVRLDP